MAYSNGVVDGTNPFRLGAHGTGAYTDGALDEVAVYKRVLTPEEISWLYNSGNGRTYSDLSSAPPSTTTYAYDPNHKHAVTSLSTGETYTYDANGNMTCRVENGITYKQDFNAENLLSAVYKMSGTCASGTVLQTTQFIYDGDGNLVKKVNPDGSKVIYVGGVYEVYKNSSSTVTQTITYYPAGGAMRVNIVGGTNTVYYTLKDQLGSASVVTNSSGVTVGETRYYPFGETRFSTGTMYTDKLFTGQRDTGLGIYYYGARFYSQKLGRFISPDSIIPSYTNPQNLNRFAYVLNNPLRYTDPTGHSQCQTQEDCEDMGTTPMGVGSTSNSPGNKPHKPKHHPHDDDPDPNPTGCVGCGLPNGGKPLNSPVQQSNCPLGSSCFYANQSDIFKEAGTLDTWSITFGIAGGIIGGIGLALLMEGIAATPAPPLAAVGVAVGIGLMVVGGGLLAEAYRTNQASSFLTGIGTSMTSQNARRIDVQSNNYHVQGTNFSFSPSTPLTSLLMQNWMQTQQNK